MSKELEKKYNHLEVETGRYEQWLQQDLFKANPKNPGKPFSIILPPPNVTGVLHLGHAWDGTIQDLLIRYKRLQGFNTLFVPGMDHAGIATQVKVAQRIKTEKNLTLQQLGKSEFLNQAWKWKTEYAQIIRQQWAKLGLALDYSREAFTLNENVNTAVNEMFVKLYHEGLIYQGTKIVNWDPVLKTAISNIEVTHKEVKGKLYYLKYYLENSKSYITVATTRPETMFADQCLVVNSKDIRYKQFVNKFVINPANNAKIPVLADDYVDIDFGTGAMKCTPAHDMNDYEIALRHHLKMPICMNKDGTMNELAHKYANQDRMQCRKNLMQDLEKANLVEKIADYVHQVGFSERSDAVIEPYLSQQWFIKMQPIAKMIIKNQTNPQTKVEFYPVAFEQQLLQWLNKIQDWCISRQLWWGHSIPVWYHNSSKQIYVGVTPPTPISEYTQDQDVLDTWFSSALWPFVTLGFPDSADYKKYYPTSCLVTAYDILFFWVARMLFMGWKFTNVKPFQHVLIHGLIRDETGRKMSKSLNNGINPMDMIEKYGADALRYFLVSNCAPGSDLRFSTIKVESAWNLINKVWNATRYVLMNLPTNFAANLIDKAVESEIDQWILAELNQLIIKVENNMASYEFVLVAKELSNFIWNKYCSWYIELNKVNLQNEKMKDASIQVLFYVLKQIIIMLHPFVPFVTEAIYEKMGYKDSILFAQYPKVKKIKINKNNNLFVAMLIEIIREIREIRKELNLPFKTKISAHINTANELFDKQKAKLNGYLKDLVNAEITSIGNRGLSTNNKVIKVITAAVIEIKMDDLINLKDQEAKLLKEQQTIENEILRSENILKNQKFLAKAPLEKITEEKTKLEKYQNQLLIIQNKIKELNNK